MNIISQIKETKNDKVQNYSMRFNEAGFNEAALNGVKSFVEEKYEEEHWRDVKQAYENNQYRVVTLLLSAFFESAVTSYLKQRYEEKIEEHKDNSQHLGTGFIEDNNFSFAHKLKIARVTGEIEENEFAVINEIRNNRNTIAHNHKAWKPSEFDIQEKDIEKAVKIYENWLGIKGRTIL